MSCPTKSRRRARVHPVTEHGEGQDTGMHNQCLHCERLAASVGCQEMGHTQEKAPGIPFPLWMEGPPSLGSCLVI